MGKRKGPLENMGMNRSSFRAIVTGAGGFLGSAVCRALAEQGAEVIALVKHRDSDTSCLSTLPRTTVLYADMAEYAAPGCLPEDVPPDVCFHFAWSGSAGPARSDADVQSDNIKHTCDLVKRCAALQCRRFVYAGSIMEYEVQAAVREGLTPPAEALYSAAKLGAGYMAGVLSASLGMEYIRTVISNVYGPGEKNPRLIHTSLRKLLSGEHCAFSPGEQMYDFIYIDDAAAMFAELGMRGIPGKTYYIGSGSPRQLKSFLTEMRDVAAPGVPIGLSELPPPAVSLRYDEFDLHAVRNDTGLSAQVSFGEGIRRTAAWIREETL